jgi:carbamoyltransferase
MAMILGINAYHGDSSAALVSDGILIAAVEEERFKRIKHWAGMPLDSIQYCLETAGIKIQEVDYIAISTDPRANLRHKAIYSLKNRVKLGSVLERMKRIKKTLDIKEKIAEYFGVDASKLKARLVNVEHHEAHAACGFFTSPFERSAILSIDGMGDFASTWFGYGVGNRIAGFRRVYYPHSVGFLYEATTRFLGFPKYGDEYKVMGLAPYGQPKYIEGFRKIIRPENGSFSLNMDYFNHGKNVIHMKWDGGEPTVDPFYSSLFEKEFGPSFPDRSPVDERMENIAASLQAVTEDVIFNLLNSLHSQFRCDNLCLVGGVAMNSVANGKAYLKTPFRNIFVPAGAADNGTSIGAAFYVWNQLMKGPRAFEMKHAFWGSSFSDEECGHVISNHSVQAVRMDDASLTKAVVDLLCGGKVVGWFQGQMEFGARALGNRTLLADPRRADMREIINTRIKFREKFRPFAPSVLEDHVLDYFEYTIPSPFMEKVVPIRSEKRAEIPAVTHVDGTGRLQTVDPETNPKYWNLISEFKKRTGVPMLLNTSLNENEPIVRTPEEAIQCFLRTKMDAIVLESYLVTGK